LKETTNQEVAGSNPAGRTSKYKGLGVSKKSQDPFNVRMVF